ncbi:MAG: DNA-formamidopyrimidine glycosylase family protein [Polyangiaceae bacterium]
MPEGDSIFQAAARLHAVLAGQRIERFRSPLPALKEADLDGHIVARVFARGKNLIIEFDDGRCLRTHLRMQGRWFVRDKAKLDDEQRERLAQAPHSLNPVLTLSLETANVVAVCERAAVAELESPRTLQRNLASLGPDLLAPEFDPEQALQNLRGVPELPIGDAIMRQSLLAGIGNVYKSELLFLERLSPFVKVSELSDAQLRALVARGQKLLNQNRSGRRRTTFGVLSRMPYYVYERSGQHCLKCDTTIQMRRQGSLQRSTYFCPECQGVREPR